MAIEAERGIGGFMNKFASVNRNRAIAVERERMAQMREQETEDAERQKKANQLSNIELPASRRGLNEPSSAINPSNAVTPPAGERAGAGVGGATPASFGSNSMAMYKALTDLGVKPEVAAGAVGSMMGESGRHLNPAAYNPNDRGMPSGGALQWRGDRLSGLYNFAGTSDIRQIPIETQAKWMQQELQGKESGALQSLLKGNSVQDGARAWTHNFERPQDAAGETARRTPMGEQFWASVQNGSVASNTPSNRNRDAGNVQAPVKVAAADAIRKDVSPNTAPPTTEGAGKSVMNTKPIEESGDGAMQFFSTLVN